MAEKQIQQILTQLRSARLAYPDAAKLLSRAKLLLLQLGALTPTMSSSSSSGRSPSATQPASQLALARETYEQGALYSIRARDADGFVRYVRQLAPLYELPASSLPPNLPERSKVTGLYLLLLLTQGRYDEFHSELEALSAREGGGGSVDVEGDRYLGYPIRLERWLMEGSYDRVWKAMREGEVPCEEYGVFSEVRSHPSLPTYPSTDRTDRQTDANEQTKNRSSPPKSAPRSPRPASAPTRPCPSRRQSRSCSSTRRAPSSTSPPAAVG